MEKQRTINKQIELHNPNSACFLHQITPEQLHIYIVWLRDVKPSQIYNNSPNKCQQKNRIARRVAIYIKTCSLEVVSRESTLNKRRKNTHTLSWKALQNLYAPVRRRWSTSINAIYVVVILVLHYFCAFIISLRHECEQYGKQLFNLNNRI